MSAVSSVGPTPSDALDGYVLDIQVGYLLRRAHQRATSVFLEGMAPDALTPTQFATLVKLAELGPMSQNHLGRTIAMDPATSQGVVRRLVEQGLIHRAADTTDRRRAVLSLTEEGRGVIERCRKRGLGISAKILSPLQPAEREVFVRLLKQLV
ncbi:MAG TPA: MarR family transcriptional regulator [Stellaceae bacterium]|nr:MarR family transcriptional regulator [Stellaceae bacterium]